MEELKEDSDDRDSSNRDSSDEGIVTIPTLSWANEDSFSYCFDGIEQGGTVAVSTIEVKTDETSLFLWKQGMKEAIDRVKPNTILVYGGKVPFDYGNTKIIYYENEVTNNWKGRG